jgi:hypothetical protein
MVDLFSIGLGQKKVPVIHHMHKSFYKALTGPFLAGYWSFGRRRDGE